MTSIWLYSILSVLAISLMSFIGLVSLSVSMERLKKVLLFLVSFAAGSMLGGAFFHLLPEAYDEPSTAAHAPLFIIIGIVLFFTLEKYLHWRHCHTPTSTEHPHPVGISNLVGDAFHNFLDGVIIAGAYLVSPGIGLATTLAVVLHEIPQEIGDFSILVHAGYTRARALFFNFLSALTALAGAIVTLAIGGNVDIAHTYLVPITIGGFIYIAAADLIPEIKREEHLGKSIAQLLMFVIGIGLMALMRVFE